MRLDDPRLATLAGGDARAVGRRVVRRGVGRPPPVHRGGAARGRRDPARPPQAVPADLRPVRRAAVLRRRATCCGPCRRGWGSASGIAICEDFWHLAVPQLLALDGAQILINVSSSPGRDLARDQRGRPRDGDVVADADADLRPADHVVRGLLQPRRRGRVDLVLGRLGGHRPRRRAGLLGAAATTRACSSSTSTSTTSAASGSPCRCCATSGPSWSRCESARAWIVDERAGPGADDVERRDGPSDRRERDGTADRPFVLPDELAIDTGRRAARHRRVHPRPAAPGGLRARRARAVGRDRLGARGLPRGRGDRRRAAAVRADAVPDLVARVARRRRGGRAPARLRVPSSSRSRRWSTGTSAPTAWPGRPATRASARRRSGAATSWRGCGWRALRPSVGVGRARRRDGQQDRVADRLHDAVRRHGVRLQPDRRPVQEPGPPDLPPRSASPRRSSARRRRPTCGPARPTRPRPASPTPSSTGCCSGGSTSAARPRSWSRWASIARRWSASTGWSRAPSSSARCRRSRSSGRGRPASTTSTRGGGRARPDPERWPPRAPRHAVRRRDADRQPRRRHPPGARGPARRAADRGRGHAAHPAPPGAVRRSRRGRSATTPGAARRASRSCSRTSRAAATSRS